MRIEQALEQMITNAQRTIKDLEQRASLQESLGSESEPGRYASICMERARWRGIETGLKEALALVHHADDAAAQALVKYINVQ